MKTKLFSVFFVLAALVIAGGTVLAQPRPVPRAPRDLGEGSIAILGVNTFGCADSALKLNVDIQVSDESLPYIVRTVVRKGTMRYTDSRVLQNIVSGQRVMSMTADESGSPVNLDYPLEADTTITIQMLLTRENARPLWYAEIRIDDCEGTPNTVSLNVNAPARVVNTNVKFKPGAVNPTRPEKWTSQGKIVTKCTATCITTMTGKPGKTIALRQTVKFSPPLQDATRYGIIMVADITGVVSGHVQFHMKKYFNNDSNLDSFSTLVIDTPNTTSRERSYMPSGNGMSGQTDKFTFEFTFTDGSSASFPANGKVRLYRIFFYVVEF